MSVHHLESVRNSKQSKVEYLQILAELDRLNITNYYETTEISSLAHYQPASIGSFLNYINFSNPSTTVSKSEARRCLDDAAFQSSPASERIFLARNCKEWPDLTCSSNLCNFSFFFYNIILFYSCVQGLP